MQLNSKSGDACRLASRPGAPTGESLTTVAIKAPKAGLDLEQRARARSEGEPLLFKGADFAKTDVEPALKD